MSNNLYDCFYKILSSLRMYSYHSLNKNNFTTKYCVIFVFTINKIIVCSLMGRIQQRCKKIKTKFFHCRRHSVFRALVLDVGKPSTSPWLNHVPRWFVHMFPASPANDPTSRLLRWSRKGRYLEGFSFYPSQKQGTLLNFCSFDSRRTCFSRGSCVVWNNVGHRPLLAQSHTEWLATLSADGRAWVSLICRGASK